MNTWKILSLVALVAVGCGKKKEPVSAGSGASNEITLGVLDLNRHALAGENDKRMFVSHLKFKNTLSGPVTVTRVDWRVDFDDQTAGDHMAAFNETVAAGATADLVLDAQFAWMDATEIKADKAHITGTVTWTGPKGNQNTTTFDLRGAVPPENAPADSKAE